MKQNRNTYQPISYQNSNSETQEFRSVVEVLQKAKSFSERCIGIYFISNVFFSYTYLIHTTFVSYRCW